MKIELVELVRDANLERSSRTLLRRLVKIDEELGELSGAILSATNPASYKRLTFQDVREEAVDTAIISLDVLFSFADLLSGHPFDGVLAEIRHNTFGMPMFDESDLLSYARRMSKMAGMLTVSHDSRNFDCAISIIRWAECIAYARFTEEDSLPLIEENVDSIFRRKVEKWLNTKHLAPQDS